jgi:RNA ligase
VKYLEKNGKKMSNCHHENPALCNLHGKKSFKPVPDFSFAQELVRPNFTIIGSIEELQEAVETKKVFRQTHNTLPYSIYKYSQTTVYGKEWNPVTLNSRGLILHDETFEIIARPFKKFFNHNEQSLPESVFKSRIEVTEKLDGSLGISYVDMEGNIHIATSGSFHSEQAVKANKIYDEKYRNRWNPNPSLTYLWEIIYPENRIVVDYGDEEDLYLLGAVNIHTGEEISANRVKEWVWKKAETHNFKNLSQVLNIQGRENKEGFIVYFKDVDLRVKIKHEEYVTLHRYATGVNSLRVWEMLQTGEDFVKEMSHMPEEFIEYVETTKKKLENNFTVLKTRIVDSYNTFAGLLPENVSQADFAKKVETTVPVDYRSFFFTLKRNGNIDDEKSVKKLWRMVKPEFEKSFWASNSRDV